MGHNLIINGVPETENQDIFKVIALPNHEGAGLSICTGQTAIVLKKIQAIDLACKILKEFPPEQEFIVGGEQFYEVILKSLKE